MAEANKFLQNLDGLDAEQYARFLREAPRGYPGAYLAAEVTTLIHFRRDQKARALCEAALARDDDGGFSFTAVNGERVNFTKGALAYLADLGTD